MLTVLREISAFLLFVALVAGLAQQARRLRRMPVGLAGAVGLALLVAVEVPLFHLLSALQALHAVPVALAHAALVALVLRPARLPRVPRRALWLLPPFALALLSSLRYSPSNPDAQVYHLARVAHWIQNGSVGLYPSPIFAQNAHAAAGEYLLLQLQLVAGTDKLAFLPQLLAWVLLAASAPAVARLAGAPSRLARWAFLPVGTLPMAVLQAGTAQNDLLAAVMAVAAGAAALPFLHARVPRLADGLLLGASVAAAAALKVLGLLAAAPLLLIAVLRLVARAVRQPRALLPGLLALGVAALLYAPEWERLRLLQSQPGYVLEWSYPAVGEWGSGPRTWCAACCGTCPVPRTW